MELHFEQLREPDIIKLRDLSKEFADINPDKVKPFLADKRNIALVAKLDDKVIGLLFGYSLTDFDGGTAMFYIYSVDIRTEYQDKGYGSRLMQYAVEWAKNNGFRKCFVGAEEDNPRACRVYEKIGMDSTKVREFTLVF